VEKGPNGGRGFYDPQSEVNRLFDEMFGGLGTPAASNTPPRRSGRRRSTSFTRAGTCSSMPSCPASSAKTWR
jgi:hypothetical protein